MILLKLSDMVCLGFAKAFDTLSHCRLLHKLQNWYGIKGFTLNWIQAFLSNQLQCIEIGSSLSEYSNVKSSIPQGSVLKPLLFLLYVDDVTNSLTANICCKLFTDDTKLYHVHNNINVCREQVCKVLQIPFVSGWMTGSS